VQHFFCGLTQFVLMFGYSFLVISATIQAFEWIIIAKSLATVFERAVLVAGGAFVVLATLPVLVKWLLIGRWKRQRIRAWGLTYLRFWFVKLLVRTNPIVLLAGTPLYVLYLRALGARIGRNVLILSPHVPVCTDLLTIGDNAIIRKDSFFLCYRARAGMIETGPVQIGKDAFVGEYTVLDIDTTLGDAAQIGHSSALQAGQSVPDGEHRIGSPARQRTDVDYRDVDQASCGRVRRVLYPLAEVLPPMLLLTGLAACADWLFEPVAHRHGFLKPSTWAIHDAKFYTDALTVSAVLFFSAILFGLVFVAVVPRLLNRFLQPGKVYPLYGFHYWVQRAVTRLTNVQFFTFLFGDSSYIVHYLRWIGYDLGRIVQTGSNFGMAVKHDNPFLVSVGGGTMVADGLSMINVDYSSTSFRVAPVSIGGDNFLGNQIAYPSQGKTGHNCLLGTKVLVPMEGEKREGIGLLGAPSFEIPRTVLRDSKLAPKSDEDLQRRLAAKNRHNIVTMGQFLLMHWAYAFSMILLLLTAADFAFVLGTSTSFGLAMILGSLLSVIYYSLWERATTLFRPMRPKNCSIYDPAFWSHERHWKLSLVITLLVPFNGTPFRCLFWRLLGVKIGRRVLDDGAGITERPLTTIGDDCTFNDGSIIQAHSQEDGGFKSDYVEIGAGCTVGVGAWVHYGVTMGDGSQIEANTFLMKGEEVPPRTRWGDNPARELQDDTTTEPQITMAAPSRPEALEVPATTNGGQPV
jgi:non-ribosomal peptide synthetase-like protein